MYHNVRLLPHSHLLGGNRRVDISKFKQYKVKMCEDRDRLCLMYTVYFLVASPMQAMAEIDFRGSLRAVLIHEEHGAECSLFEDCRRGTFEVQM